MCMCLWVCIGGLVAVAPALSWPSERRPLPPAAAAPHSSGRAPLTAPLSLPAAPPCPAPGRAERRRHQGHVHRGGAAGAAGAAHVRDAGGLCQGQGEGAVQEEGQRARGALHVEPWQRRRGLHGVTRGATSSGMACPPLSWHPARAFPQQRRLYLCNIQLRRCALRKRVPDMVGGGVEVVVCYSGVACGVQPQIQLASHCWPVYPRCSAAASGLPAPLTASCSRCQPARAPAP